MLALARTVESKKQKENVIFGNYKTTRGGRGLKCSNFAQVSIEQGFEAVRASNPALDKLEIHSEIESENDNRTRD